MDCALEDQFLWAFKSPRLELRIADVDHLGVIVYRVLKLGHVDGPLAAVCHGLVCRRADWYVADGAAGEFYLVLVPIAIRCVNSKDGSLRISHGEDGF